jgi:hypothetical protein
LLQIDLCIDCCYKQCGSSVLCCCSPITASCVLSNLRKPSQLVKQLKINQKRRSVSVLVLTYILVLTYTLVFTYIPVPEAQCPTPPKGIAAALSYLIDDARRRPSNIINARLCGRQPDHVVHLESSASASTCTSRQARGAAAGWTCFDQPLGEPLNRLPEFCERIFGHLLHLVRCRNGKPCASAEQTRMISRLRHRCNRGLEMISTRWTEML